MWGLHPENYNWEPDYVYEAKRQWEKNFKENNPNIKSEWLIYEVCKLVNDELSALKEKITWKNTSEKNKKILNSEPRDETYRQQLYLRKGQRDLDIKMIQFQQEESKQDHYSKEVLQKEKVIQEIESMKKVLQSQITSLENIRKKMKWIQQELSQEVKKKKPRDEKKLEKIRENRDNFFNKETDLRQQIDKQVSHRTFSSDWPDRNHPYYKQEFIKIYWNDDFWRAEYEKRFKEPFPSQKKKSFQKIQSKPTKPKQKRSNKSKDLNIPAPKITNKPITKEDILK